VIPAQKFAVGEVVMLRSIAYPELNTDRATVLRAAYTESMSVLTRRLGYVWVYDLDVIPPIGRWSESALRKRPPPSTQSFDELMREANTPQKSSTPLEPA